MKKLLWFFFLISTPSLILNAQQYKSEDGHRLNPHTTYFSLNVFVNIIYDVTPVRNPRPESKDNGIWDYYGDESINKGHPVYLDYFLDDEFTGESSINGSLTRYYYESSLGNFILLGDFVIVNIKQSTIETYLGISNGDDFTYGALMKAAILFINDSDPLGLETVDGHNSITDYDLNGDDRVDLTNFYFRNSVKTDYYNHGSLNGGGHAGQSHLQIKMNGQLWYLDSYTVQGREFRNLGDDPRMGSVTHEIAHHLLGGNNAHTTGYQVYENWENTYLAPQAGHSIFGYVCANGFERWRLSWLSDQYNPNQYRIAAYNKQSDISKQDNNQTFNLRDFLTTGDAIRIKLPYKDADALDQYIWIENHQVGSNEKIDMPRWPHATCRLASAGVYMYYQAGWDILGSNNKDSVFPGNSNFLRPITAEGKYDWEILHSQLYKANCVNTSDTFPIQKLVRENPFCGLGDMEQHFDVSLNELFLKDKYKTWIKKDLEGETTKNLSSFGDEKDAFTGNTKINMGTNPAPVNAITCHNEFTDITTKKLSASSASLNNETIYLSGLSIEVQDQGNGNFYVYVKWDDYDIENDTRWTGNMVLKENVNLTANKTITIDQNPTPVQLTKVNGYFSPKSKLVCDSSSDFTMQPGSQLILDDSSEIVIKAGSYLELNDAQIVLNNGSKLTLEDGAELSTYGNSDIITNSGSNFCVEQGSIINGSTVSSDPITICYSYVNQNIQLISIENINVCPIGAAIGQSSVVKLRAPSIVLSTGFHAEEGCYFKAKSFIPCEASDIFKRTEKTEDKKDIEGLISKNDIIQVYPNPSEGIFTLSYTGKSTLVQIVITDITGKVVYNEKKNNNLNQIDLSTYPKGLYILKVITGNDILTERIIIR